ncbi:MAG TPA: glycerophosphodiester phosphodiesterase family protein [Mycobacteriales bacterium]
MGSPPLVVAHRGSSYALAEHTLGAYLRAIEEGADALECDVRLTRDGHLVCVHDRTVDRTSSGHGVVSDFDLDDLRGFDFGSWHSPPDRYVEERDSTEAPVLTLDRLLGVVEETGIRLLVETKHPTRYAGLVEQKLVEVLTEHGMQGAGSPVTVMSFATVALRRIRLLAPALRTVQLYKRVPTLRRDGSLPVVADVSGPGIAVVRADPGYVRRVQARGRQVYVWTVDETADIDLVLALGVDAVITNRPAEVLSRLAR